MNAKLAAISQRASEDFLSFIGEGEVKIQEAWDSVVEEAQANETKPVLSLAFSVKLHLDDDKMETALSFGVKHKLSRDSSIPDPSQPDLLKEAHSTVTMKTGDKSVTVPLGVFNRAVDKLSKRA